MPKNKENGDNVLLSASKEEVTDQTSWYVIPKKITIYVDIRKHS